MISEAQCRAFWNFGPDSCFYQTMTKHLFDSRWLLFMTPVIVRRLLPFGNRLLDLKSLAAKHWMIQLDLTTFPLCVVRKSSGLQSQVGWELCENSLYNVYNIVLVNTASPHQTHLCVIISSQFISTRNKHSIYVMNHDWTRYDNINIL